MPERRPNAAAFAVNQAAAAAAAAPNADRQNEAGGGAGAGANANVAEWDANVAEWDAHELRLYDEVDNGTLRLSKKISIFLTKLILCCHFFHQLLH